MGFLAPAALALAVLIPIIVAMYLLKLRRTEQVVSSVYLWRRMIRDVEANAPWQRLRRNWLLILQLLFLAALIVALARPFQRVQGAGGQALILILDTSASMAAVDMSPTRLEAAKAQARQLVDGLPDRARVTLITASQNAQVLVSSSQDRRQIELAIDGVQAGTGGSDLTAALELASAVAARQPDTDIMLLSDGRATLPDRLAIQGRLRYLPLGRSGDNQAISTLSLEPTPGGAAMTAFAQVANYGHAPAQRRLALYADGRLVDAYDLQVAPGAQQAVVAEDLPPGTQVLEAQLAGDDVLPLDDRAWAVHDAAVPAAVTLVTDGNLFLETGLGLLPGLEVTTISPEDFEQVLEEGRLEGWKTGRLEAEATEETDQPANLPTIQPSNLPTIRPSSLTILDSYVPLTATLPAGNILFIAPPRSTPYFTVTGTLDLPALRPVDPEDPLLTYVDLGDVSVLQAVRISLPPWARPVIVGDLEEGRFEGWKDGRVEGEATEETDQSSSLPAFQPSNLPILFAGETDGRRLAVLAFDLRRSDLPLQVAFPVLLANLTGWLAPGRAEVEASPARAATAGRPGRAAGQVAPGAPVVMTLPPEVEAATVTRPDGSTARLTPQDSRIVFADTGQLGVYRVTTLAPPQVRGDEGPRTASQDEGLLRETNGETDPSSLVLGPSSPSVPRHFAVNLFSPQESDVEPAQSLPLLEAGQGGEDVRADDRRGGRREWWRPLAWLALMVLVAEWLLYHRGAVVRLVEQVKRGSG